MSRLLLCLLLLLPLPAFAAKWGLGLYMDQDMLLPVHNEDRDYTMGVAVEVFNQGDIKLLDWPVVEVGRWLGDLAPPRQARRSLLIGSVNFTPDDLSASAPLTDDRPYASLLYVSNKRVHASGDTAVGLEAQFGLLGTYVAREVQRGLHHFWRDIRNSDEPVEPMGWDNQISAGGEPTLRLRVAHARRLTPANRHYDVAAGWDASLGFKTNASVGLSGRIGWLDSGFWTLPYDPINRGNFLPSFAGDELYFWGAWRARLIGYDAMLQGQFRDSVLRYGAGDLERVVYEGGLGVTAAWRQVQLTLAANAKSAELRHGQAARTHWWGGAYLMIRL